MNELKVFLVRAFIIAAPSVWLGYSIGFDQGRIDRMREEVRILQQQLAAPRGTHD